MAAVEKLEMVRGADLSAYDVSYSEAGLRVRRRPGQERDGLPEQLDSYVVDMSRDGDGRYVCTVPALPGAISDGETKGAALDNVAEAIEAMHEAGGIKKEFVVFSVNEYMHDNGQIS